MKNKLPGEYKLKAVVCSNIVSHVPLTVTYDSEIATPFGHFVVKSGCETEEEATEVAEQYVARLRMLFDVIVKQELGKFPKAKE
jgi:hypothetical protein